MGLADWAVMFLCLACVLLLLRCMPSLGRARDEARKVRCASNLNQLAKGMNMYLLKYGDNSYYAVPAEAFRGDAWLASLYWTGIVGEPRVFLCPGTDDGKFLPATPPRDMTSDFAVEEDAVSYAGLCRGLTGPYAHRNTRYFTETAVGSASVMACDDNEGTQNHSDGMNVVYIDTHVEFIAGPPADTYDLIGAKGSKFEHLDSGER
jgi:prepilin-type processing-associated H-X9-DG protein